MSCWSNLACSVACCFLESRAQQISTARCGKLKKFQADAAKTARTHLLLRWFARLILVCVAIQCLHLEKMFEASSCRTWYQLDQNVSSATFEDFHQQKPPEAAPLAFLFENTWKAQHLAQLHCGCSAKGGSWPKPEPPLTSPQSELSKRYEKTLRAFHSWSKCKAPATIYGLTEPESYLDPKCHQIAVESTTLWLQLSNMLGILQTAGPVFVHISQPSLTSWDLTKPSLRELADSQKKTPPINRWPPSKQRSPAICLLPMDTSSSLWQHRFERRSNTLASCSKLVWFNDLFWACYFSHTTPPLTTSITSTTNDITLQPLLSVRKRMNWRRHCSEVGGWSWFPQRQCSRRAGWTAWAIQTWKFQTGWRLGALGWQMACMRDESGLLLQGWPDSQDGVLKHRLLGSCSRNLITSQWLGFFPSPFPLSGILLLKM